MPGNRSIQDDSFSKQVLYFLFLKPFIPCVLEKVRLASIHEAVRYGDVLELQSMVQRGAGINDPDSKFKFTPLHWAAHHGSLEVKYAKVKSRSFKTFLNHQDCLKHCTINWFYIAFIGIWLILTASNLIWFPFHQEVKKVGILL